MLCVLPIFFLFCVAVFKAHLKAMLLFAATIDILKKTTHHRPYQRDCSIFRRPADCNISLIVPFVN